MVMLHEFLDQFEEGAAYVKRGNPKFGLRWIAWPTNTFCAAVAWRNYPPAEGTSVTVLNAVANLDRVRELKQGVREAKIGARHQQALAAARRKEELQAVTAGGDIPEGQDLVGKVGVPGSLANVAAVPIETRQEVPTPAAATPTVPPSPRKPNAGARDRWDAPRVGESVDQDVF